MSDARWRRTEELFHSAADLAPAERAAFLARACAGDDELRQKVEALLAQDAAQDNVFEAAVQNAAGLVGQQIGPYFVTGLIGKGGMGEVYRAHDNRLERDVAIKLLPAALAQDPERLARFTREAKVLASLNHPNIAQIYGVEDQALVMELVAGHALKGPLPLETALNYARQIAAALEAAHEKGIVHRDLKPANIMVTPEGAVKVLDFGLAAVAPVSTDDSDPTHSPTLTMQTRTGVIMGTAAYMSPEQAAGKVVDKRADIWSFGAVLWEMLTGRPLFEGETVSHTLAEVLQGPIDFDKLPRETPPGIRSLLRRCLDRNVKNRLRDIGEARVAIDAPLGDAPPPATAPAWRVPALIALAAAALVFAAWLGTRLFHQQPITFQRLTFRRGDVITARFAPGGSVVYAAEWDGGPLTLFLAQPGSREARDLGLPPANILSVSPQSEMALLLSSREPNTFGTLATVPLSGGAPRDILENVASGDWRPDGKAFAVVRSVEGHHRVEYPIGTVLYQTESLRPPVHLRVSRQGDAVAFFDYSDAGDYSLCVIQPPRARRVLSRGWLALAGIAWSPGGKEIWFSGGRPGDSPALHAVDLSGRERLLTQIPGWGSLYDVAPDFQVLLANVDSRIGLQCLAPGAKDERDLAWLDASSLFDLSGDGQWILFGELSAGEGRNPALYLRRTVGAPPVKLGYGSRAALSGDGKRVACIRQDGANSQLMVLPTGAGESTTLPTPGIRPESVEWFPDGKRVLFIGFEADRLPRTYILDLAGRKARPVTSAGVRASRISPDGRMAVAVNAGKLFLHSLDSGVDTLAGVVEPGDSVIRWSGDGRYLFVQHDDSDGHGLAILRVEARGGRKETWRKLKTPDATASFFSKVRLSADGKAYAVSFQRDLATLYIVRGVK